MLYPRLGEEAYIIVVATLLLLLFFFTPLFIYPTRLAFGAAVLFSVVIVSLSIFVIKLALPIVF